jgi:hypothetical protein
MKEVKTGRPAATADRAAEKARERERLAAALRENLKKRKTQARERAGPPEGEAK